MSKIKNVGWFLFLTSLIAFIVCIFVGYLYLNTNNPFNLFLTTYIWQLLLLCLLVFTVGLVFLTYGYLAKINKTLGIVGGVIVTIALLFGLFIYQNRNNGQNVEFKNPGQNGLGESFLKCEEKQTLEKAKNCSVLIGDQETGHGSGFFINSNYIVTNLHVVSYSENGYVKVYLNEGYEDVPIIGYSEIDDIAVLQTKQAYNSCDWTSTTNLDLAETVYAFGWPKDAFGESTITKGIFSRRLQFSDSNVKMIQTDTPINPGNSGGPLVNQCGIVGINTSKNAWIGQDIPSEGIGYAIDANYAKGIVEQIVQTTVGGPIIPPKNPSKETVGTQNSFNFNQAVSYDYDSVIYWEQRIGEDEKVLASWKGAQNNDYVDKDGVKKMIKNLEQKIQIAKTLWDGYTNGKITYTEANNLNNNYIKLHNESVLLSKQLNIQGEQNVYVQCIKSWEDLEKEYNQDFTEQKKECKGYLD